MRTHWGWLIGAVVADRLLKNLAVNGVEWSIPGFRFVLFKNDGLVFSLPSGSTVALWVILIGSLVLGYVTVQAKKKNPPLFFPAMLMLFGAVSNLYDRIMHGFVIDWAYFGRWWPIFNLADCMIVGGLIWYLWLREKNPKSIN